MEFQYLKSKGLEAMEQFQFLEQEVLTPEQQRIFSIAFRFGYEKAIQDDKIERTKVDRYCGPPYGDSSGLSYCRVCNGHDYNCKCELPSKMFKRDLDEAKKKILRK